MAITIPKIFEHESGIKTRLELKASSFKMDELWLDMESIGRGETRYSYNLKHRNPKEGETKPPRFNGLVKIIKLVPTYIKIHIFCPKFTYIYF